MPRLTSFTSSRALTPLSNVGLPTVVLPTLLRNQHFATSEITGSGDRRVLSLTSLLDEAYLNEVTSVFTAGVFTTSSIELTTGQTVTDSLRYNNTIIGDTYNINIEADGVTTWGSTVDSVTPDLDTLNTRNADVKLVNGEDFGSPTQSGNDINLGSITSLPLTRLLVISGNPLQAYPAKITSSNGDFSINYIGRGSDNVITVYDFPELGYPRADLVSYTDIETIELLKFRSPNLALTNFLLLAGQSSYNEDATVTFTFYTRNVAQGALFPFTITGVSSFDFTSGATFGTVNIGSDGRATISRTLDEDGATEGNETMTVTIGGGIAQASTTILDTSVNVNYTLASSEGTTVTEGTAFTITLTTVGIADGTELGYTVTGVSAGDLAAGSLTGSFTISSNQATADFEIASDRITEGGETFDLALDNGSASISVNITDTSLTPTFNVVASIGTVTEGNSVIMFVNTTNIENGFTVPYTVTGINADDLSSGSLTGNVTITDSQGSVTFTLAEDFSTEGTETLTFTISPDVPGSPTDSVTVAVGDISQDPTYDSITFGATAYTEGSTVSFTVASPNTPQGTTVNYTLGTGATTSSGTATFNTAGEASGSFTLSTDSTTEGTKQIAVTLAATDSRGIATESLSASVYILDAGFGAVQTVTSSSRNIFNPLGSFAENSKFGQGMGMGSSYAYIGAPGDYNNRQVIFRYTRSGSAAGTYYSPSGQTGALWGYRIAANGDDSKVYIGEPGVSGDGRVSVIYPSQSGAIVRETYDSPVSGGFMGGYTLTADPESDGAAYATTRTNGNSTCQVIKLSGGSAVNIATVSGLSDNLPPAIFAGPGSYWGYQASDQTISIRNKSNNNQYRLIDCSTYFTGGGSAYNRIAPSWTGNPIYYDQYNDRYLLAFVTISDFAIDAALDIYNVVSGAYVATAKFFDVTDDIPRGDSFLGGSVRWNDHYLTVTCDDAITFVFDSRSFTHLYTINPNATTFNAGTVTLFDNTVFIGDPDFDLGVGTSSERNDLGRAFTYDLPGNADPS